MSHEMETGLRKDKETGNAIPAHFIQEVTAKWKDQVVMTAFWSGGVSKNPYLSFKFNGGERVTRSRSPGSTTRAPPRPAPPRSSNPAPKRGRRRAQRAAPPLPPADTNPPRPHRRRVFL
jgi:hypothetical protein